MHTSTTSARRWYRVSALAALALLLTALPAWAVSDSTTLPNGAELTVSIDSPTDGTELLADGAPAAVPVSGTASIGLGTPQATLVYVFDASGSTGNPGGACGTILVCQQTFFTGLNTAAAASGSVNQIGLAAFGFDAVTADMTPAGGDDPLGDPDDGNTVVNSIVLTNGGFNYQVGQYSVKNGNADGTNYSAALQEALTILGASSDPSKFLVFASDGLSNEGTVAAFDAAVASLTGTGTVASSIAIGTSASCTGGTAGQLQDIAVNGGQCYAVPDPNDLPDLIPNLIGSTLTKVELTVDGGTPSVLTTVPPTPAAGPVMVTYATSTPGLSPGSHDICATSFGTDVTGGSADVDVCVNVDVYDLVLTPASATNELGSDNSHTVTATLQGPAGEVGGYLVDFTVGGQNAGAAGVCNPAPCTTNASGVVTFTYSVPVAPGSIGVDTITAEVTLNSPNGQTDTEQVSKEWRDTTPPVVSCRPTTNPSGKNVPPAGDNPSSGQNPDGFYELLATDDVDPNAEITITDTGSSFVAGPYASGTKIKLTQAPGATPNVKPAPGDIDWHVTLKGDAVVVATDDSGNSASVSCLVPPPPK